MAKKTLLPPIDPNVTPPTQYEPVDPNFRPQLGQLIMSVLLGGGVGGLGSLLPESIWRTGLAYGMSREQQQAQDRANAAGEARYGQAIGNVQSLYPRVGEMEESTADLLGRFRGLESEAMGELGSLEAQLRPRLEGDIGADTAASGDLRDLITGMYEDRLQRNLGTLEGMGEQARTDINQVFDEAGEDVESRLSERGLGSSTILAPTLGNVARERTGALGRLDEELRRERIALDADLSGDAIRSAEELGRYGIELPRESRGRAEDFIRDLFGQRLTTGLGAGGAALSAEERIGTRPLQLELGLADAINNIILGRQDVAPDGGILTGTYRNLGGGVEGGPDEPNAFETIGGQAAGTALGIGGGAALAKIFAVACLDAETFIACRHGNVPLRDVRVGDDVYDFEGKLRKVVAKDIGFLSHKQRRKYVTVTIDNGDSITLTPEHLLDGIPAKDWKQGDTMQLSVGDAQFIPAKVSWVEEVPYRPGADIMLLGNYDYVTTGGFVVCSMIGRCWSELSDQHKHLLQQTDR